MSDIDILDEFLKQLSQEQQPEIVTGDTTVDRLPVVFAIDHSGSTKASGDIDKINAFLSSFAEHVASGADDWSRIRSHLDVYIVAYADSAEVLLPWTPGEDLTPDLIPTLAGDGTTEMAAGLQLAGAAMMQRLADYRRRELRCFRGYIFNVTDGKPTDMSPDGAGSEQWARTKTVLDRFEHIGSKGDAYCSTFHCASRDADRALLRSLAYRDDRVIDLEVNNFDKLFEFVRLSLIAPLDAEG